MRCDPSSLSTAKSQVDPGNGGNVRYANKAKTKVGTILTKHIKFSWLRQLV